VTEGAITDLRAVLGDRLSTAAAVREQHGKGVTYHAAHPPDAVAFARTTEEVASIVRTCARHGTPVIAFGTGTSLEGHIAAIRGGVTIDLSGMNRVLSVNSEDLDCRAEAGLTHRALNAQLRDTGLFFPVDPGADASLGGMAATRASGTNAVRYGTMSENVLGLTVVTAEGQVVRTGGRARKSAAGYDLTRLFVGSEGTLGIITELQLRLHGIPEAISAAVCPFRDLAGAVGTVIATIQSGIPVARIELLDDVQMRACIRHSKLDLPEAPTLFFEFHGAEGAVAEQARMVGALAAERGGPDFRWATRPEERTRLWAARHDAFWAARELRPGAEARATDVCVPISRLAEAILEVRRDIDANRLLAPIVGHVGDGNFHLTFLLDPDDPDEGMRADAVNDRMVGRALAAGGTCTGEHGIGLGKLRFLEAEHGDAVALMACIKRALDPQNILNPGKMVRLDAADDSGTAPAPPHRAG
jgi:D-lactate dehydrogenase (cytochrome)